MSKPKIIFPEGYESAEWEAETKGWLQRVIVVLEGRSYEVTFYDPVRLAQDLEDELKQDVVFLERNMLIVESVTRSNMEAAIVAIVESGRSMDLLPEPQEIENSNEEV